MSEGRFPPEVGFTHCGSDRTFRKRGYGRRVGLRVQLDPVYALIEKPPRSCRSFCLICYLRNPVPRKPEDVRSQLRRCAAFWDEGLASRSDSGTWYFARLDAVAKPSGILPN